MARSKRLDDYHRHFAETLIEQIKTGTAPFQKSWKPGERALPESLRTGEPYRGGNSLRLQVEAARRGYTDSRWGTYRQIAAAGGHVKRGEKGTQILAYFRQRAVPAKDDQGQPKLTDAGEPVYTRVATRRFAKVYTVFNAEQTGGLPAQRQAKPAPEWQIHEKAQAIIDASGVDVRHQAGDRAFYNVRTDQVVLPEPGQFPSAGGYYQTALHELGHATGHPDRLDRDTLGKPHGSPDYAREELRAEIAAMMTGDRIGLGHEPQNGTAYVASWVKALEDNPREINDAAIDAEKISTYLIEPTRERIEQREQTTPGEPARDEDREPSQELTPAPAPQAAAARQQADFNRNIRLAADAALDGLGDRNGRALRVEEGRPPDQLIRDLKTVRAAASRNLHDPRTADFAGIRRDLHDHAITAAGLTPEQREAVRDLADNFRNQAQDHGRRDFKRLDLDQALADRGQPAPDRGSDHAERSSPDTVRFHTSITLRDRVDAALERQGMSEEHRESFLRHLDTTEGGLAEYAARHQIEDPARIRARETSPASQALAASHDRPLERDDGPARG